MKYGDMHLSDAVGRELVRLATQLPTLLIDDTVVRAVLRRACNVSGAISAGLLVLSDDPEPVKIAGAVGPSGRSPTLASAVRNILDPSATLKQTIDGVHSIGLPWPPDEIRLLRDPDDAYDMAAIPLRDAFGRAWGWALFAADTLDSAQRATTATLPLLDAFSLWSWVRHARAIHERAGGDGFNAPDLFRIDRIVARLLHDANGSLASAAMQNELLDIAALDGEQILKAQARTRESLTRVGNATALLEEVVINWYAAVPHVDPVKCAVVAAMFMRDLETSGSVSISMLPAQALPQVAVAAPGTVVTIAYIQVLRYFFPAEASSPVRSAVPVSLYVDFDGHDSRPGMVCLCVSIVNPTASMLSADAELPYSLLVRHNLLHAIVEAMSGSVDVVRGEQSVHIHLALPIR